MGIIIQDLVKDLMRFLVVLSLFMIGFSFSSSAIFLDTRQPNMTESGYYYPHSVIIDMASDPLVSFQYLYFALFGLVVGEITVHAFAWYFLIWIINYIAHHIIFLGSNSYA